MADHTPAALWTVSEDRAPTGPLQCGHVLAAIRAMPLAGALPTGSAMMVHHVTGTSSMCNDFHDNAGDHVRA